MSHEHKQNVPQPIRFLFENSVFLISGALIALVWANLDPDRKDSEGHVVEQGSYHQFINYDLAHIPADLGLVAKPSESDEHPSSTTGVSHEPSETKSEDEQKHAGGHAHSLFAVQIFINDILMALFFAIAGKEVWEALLPGGALSNPRKAAVPLLATAGGVIGPAALYIIGALILNQTAAYGRGWAIPCATDIAFSYLVARIIFGNGHPAIAFLLLLAIADDAAGLVILAVFYPNPATPLNPWWLLLSVTAIVLGFGMRKLRLHSFWWYLLIPGTMSWFAFYQAGIHAALGLVPIIPCLPHAATDLGIFAREELKRHDTLSEFEHWWKWPVEVILGLFGLVNAGVVFSNVGLGTSLVLIGLLAGKPLGIALFTWISDKLLKLQIPGGMNYREVVSLGMVAGIGFTVALFVSTAAFEPGVVQDEVKMGALGSFFAAFLAFGLARAIGVRPYRGEAKEPQTEADDDVEVEAAEMVRA